MSRIPDFTLVVGVDALHLKQLAWTYPTWKKHKPSLIQRPMVVFYDYEQVDQNQIREVLDERENLTLVPWPPEKLSYERSMEGRLGDPQRYKMLSGFVHVPPVAVSTPYWLKVDTDVTATGKDDWIDPKWFRGQPAIVSHPWGFTKPADQMLYLDQWTQSHKEVLSILAKYPPLALQPIPGWERLRHKRIISWCAFFHTTMTRLASSWARLTCGIGKLPVPSQDGYLWYVSARMKHGIVTPKMKELGWVQKHSFDNVRQEAQKSLGIHWTQMPTV